MPGKYDTRLGRYRDKDGETIYVGGTSNVIDLYVSNETELLAAWAFFIAQSKSVRVWVNGNITLTANRSFSLDYATSQLKFFEIRGIGLRPIICDTFTLTVGRIFMENITISRNDWGTMLYIQGGVFEAENLHFRYYNENGTLTYPMPDIEIIGAYTYGTGSIKLKTISHASGDSSDNNLTGNIQPFTILNSATGASVAGNNVYISIAEVQALSNYNVFSRVLLQSNTNVKYMVTGDESWYHDSAQQWPGSGNIITQSKLLKTSAIDLLKIADDTTPSATNTMLVAVTADGKAVKTNKSARLAWLHYKARLTQTGTDAPTDWIINATDYDFIGAGLWSRVSAGVYRNTNVGAFIENQTLPDEEYFYSIEGYLYHLKRISADVMELRTYEAGAVWDSATSAIIGTLADGLLTSRYLSISVQQTVS